jgi:hypothetical protein
MKIIIVLVGVSLLALGTACQSNHEGVGITGNAGAADVGIGGESEGYGQSGTGDYRQVLAEPGPF